MPNLEAYSTWYILSTNATISKGIQTITFIVYIYYYYKLSILNGTANRYHNKYLTVIAMTMGASIGISHIIWVLTPIIGSESYQVIGAMIGSTFQIIQQCVIMISFTCSPKTCQLCKELFSRDH